MKKYLLLSVLFLLNLKILPAQNVGIGTTDPVARLHVADSSVVFTANLWSVPSIQGHPPISGNGRRMMWYADKSAFRTGAVSDNFWNKDSIGNYSFAAGLDVKAKGEYSVSFGWDNQSLGPATFSTGINNIASGPYAFVSGSYQQATGNNSSAFGYSNIASAGTAFSTGFQNRATGNVGFTSGAETEASGDLSFTAGIGTKAKYYNSFVTGSYNDTTDGYFIPYQQNVHDRIFQIGNGFSHNNRNTAVSVLRNGNFGIGVLHPVARLHVKDSSVLFTGPNNLPAEPGKPPVSGAGTRMMWYADKAAFRVGNTGALHWDKDSVGRYSFASGLNTKAKGESAFAGGAYSAALGNNSVALGFYATASNDGASALGYVATASGFSSTAIGFGARALGNYSYSIGNNTIANAGGSVSIGDNAVANGVSSTSFGYNTKSNSDYSFVTGKFNDTTNTNRLFEIGNGTADNARKNAITVLQNGKTGVNTTTPFAQLHVADSSVLFTAPNNLPANPSETPVSGPGNRMMWYADKAAFRVGNVTADNWNKNNIGINSFATGSNTQAAGITSFAAGNFSYATGDVSNANGFSVFAKAKAASSFGIYNDNTDAPNAQTEAPTDRLFQVGNGSTNLSRSNALTILRNGNTGLGNTNPVTKLDIAGGNNWDLINGEGDMRVGNANYRIKLGIALGGGGIGAAGIMQSGGVSTLNIGAGNKNLIQLNGGNNSVDFTNTTGGIRINGNAGTAGQVLTSNGTSAAPAWKSAPSFITLAKPGDPWSSFTFLIGDGVHSIPVPGIDNESIFIPQASTVLVRISANIIPPALSGLCSGRFEIEIWESSTNTKKLSLRAAGSANGYDGATLERTELVQLAAGFHQIRAFHQRGHYMFSGDSEMRQHKIIMQIFPN
jgi:hypothetical protein